MVICRVPPLELLGIQLHPVKKKDTPSISDTVDFMKRKFGNTSKDVFVPWEDLKQWGKETGWVGPDTIKLLKDEYFQEKLDYDIQSKGILIPRRLTEAEKEYLAKDMANQLFGIIDKAEAEGRGFSDVSSMKEYDAEMELRENTFSHCYIGPGDQEILMGQFNACLAEGINYDYAKDCIDASMTDYVDLDWRTKPPTVKSRRTYWKVLEDPAEERFFPTDNHEVNRECVQALASAKGYVFGPTGWVKR